MKKQKLSAFGIGEVERVGQRKAEASPKSVA
jgi:hypothetical protein